MMILKKKEEIKQREDTEKHRQEECKSGRRCEMGDEN